MDALYVTNKIPSDSKSYFQFDLDNGMSLRVEAISFSQAIRLVIESFDFEIMDMVKSIYNIQKYGN